MTVTVFTNPSNPQCEATEQELAKLGVRYDTVDLTKNPSTFEQIKTLASSRFRSSSHRTPHGVDIGRISSASSRKASPPKRVEVAGHRVHKGSAGTGHMQPRTAQPIADAPYTFFHKASPSSP